MHTLQRSTKREKPKKNIKIFEQIEAEPKRRLAINDIVNEIYRLESMLSSEVDKSQKVKRKQE